MAFVPSGRIFLKKLAQQAMDEESSGTSKAFQ
jgi:hypothetical protein